MKVHFRNAQILLSFKKLEITSKNVYDDEQTKEVELDFKFSGEFFVSSVKITINKEVNF